MKKTRPVTVFLVSSMQKKFSSDIILHCVGILFNSKSCFSHILLPYNGWPFKFFWEIQFTGADFFKREIPHCIFCC